MNKEKLQKISFFQLRDRYRQIVNDEKDFEKKIGDKLSKLQKDREELERQNKEDMKIINDENAISFDKTAAEVRVERRNEDIKQLTTQIEGMEREKPLREKVKDIFKKYGLTVTAIVLAAGVTIEAVVGAITNALKSMGKGIANRLKEIVKKTASLLPGLLGSIVSFLFKAAGRVIGFLAENTWLLILAVVAFF